MLSSIKAHRIFTATGRATRRAAAMSSTSSSALQATQQQAFTILGGGRIGLALSEMAPSSVSGRLVVMSPALSAEWSSSAWQHQHGNIRDYCGSQRRPR